MGLLGQLYPLPCRVPCGLPTLAALVIVGACIPLPAQTALGSLHGTIRERDTGAPIAGATVTISSPALPSERRLMTGSDGSFRIPLLPPGLYTLVVLKDGFNRIKAQVTIATGSLAADFTMVKENTAACTVVVVASASVVDCTMTTSGANYSSEAAGSRVPPAWRGAPLSVRKPSAPPNTEAYHKIEDNPFKSSRLEPLSTFSIDVDTASYSNLRRFVAQGGRPPKDAVRIEELLNYFSYSYPEPNAKYPFSVATELFDCPWQAGHRLLRVGLQGRRLNVDQLPPRNLVFLIDVSGSMSDENKLPLVKQGLTRLCDSLRAQDSVAMVVYAGSSGLVLEPTSGSKKVEIKAALERLGAGGSTHGSAGIQQAYEVAKRNFSKGADNRVLLCTDGDFNVGVSDEGSLIRLIEEERKSGVFLTCLGFGMGNLKDATLEQLADKGNGHYAYIDSLSEMEKVFGAGGASLVTIAKDVKLQVEFNPSKVLAYRLIGYENRLLAAEDFNNDAKDAGEMNAGHSVTALYEIVPAGAKFDAPSVDKLKYQDEAITKRKASPELLTVKVRYKNPDGFFSHRLDFPVADHVLPLGQADEDSRWAAAVATLGLVLRDSPHKGKALLSLARTLGRGALGKDPLGYRAEFLQLIEAMDRQSAN